MNLIVNLVLFICVVPSAVIMFLLGFPKNPEKKKMIFGVRNNPRFHEGEAAGKVLEITASCRKAALIITVFVCLMSVVLLFLPPTRFTVLAWTLLVYALFLVAIPFGKGNTELKSLKKQLGITRKGVVYADLTNTSAVHGLKKPWLILPNAVCLAVSVFAILADTGVIKIAETLACERGALTLMSLSFLFLGIIIIPIAFMMDNVKNAVISKDSNINANYNRAKKKCWADLLVATSWANALYVAVYTVLCMFIYNDIVLVTGVLVYTLILVICVAIGVKTQMTVEKRYERDTDLELLDDDDYWILGMFYFNPNDTRLNVEKRFGYGGTVNIAHPAGKVIMIVTAVLLLATIGFLIWAAVSGNMDMLSVNGPF